ncbi:GTPase-activator protein for ras-like GTPase domain-containing protein [Ditylenchus destructor]|uniref:GTPase-activator protein for ras-like GTPase domain-containing protein n=1 Tax=Ditylenchus destructor TaxID=166010 RepID=A0AAD4N7A2_9BILA|nr:GTPase-activator protein for ras-like GTPase domain-containing protein [Ditylenchus destructor]
MNSVDNVLLLCDGLRSERLLVNSEQTVLQSLNTKVQSELQELDQLIWTCRHERIILHRLIRSDPSVTPANCCQLMANINVSKFTEAHKRLGHHAAPISQLFRCLHEAPKATAEFLNAVDKLNANGCIHELHRAVFKVLYGSCVFPLDEKAMLEMLGHLISLQLTTSPDPRTVLRKENSTFSKMYKLFSDEIFSAKIFLTAALHEPVMFLLSQDELFLDIDPSKSPIRFPAAERARRFGADPSSRGYKERVAKHRKHIVEKLVMVSKKFLASIENAMSSFPISLSWLVRQLYSNITNGKIHTNKDQATLICTDLIFTHFLCSAVINPEPLGIISDTPISHIARFNLIQIGQILQALSLLPYEKPSSYMAELLSNFDQGCMQNIVAKLLNSEDMSLDSIFPNAVSNLNGSEMYYRTAWSGSIEEITSLHSHLKTTAMDEISDIALRKNLKSMTKKIPSELKNLVELSKSWGDEVRQNSFSQSIGSGGPPSRSNSSGKLRNLADKGIFRFKY